MLVAYYAFLVLAGLTPVLLFIDRVWVDAAIALYSAVTLTAIAVSLRPGEAGHWLKTVRWALVIAALPLVWLIVQLLPLPLGAFSKSVWQSAAAALGTSLLSSTTIDPGLTVLALGHYLSLIAIGAIAAAVSIDRQQAARALVILSYATLAMALISLGGSLGELEFLGKLKSTKLYSAAAAGSIYGMVLFAAIAMMIVEHQLVRRTRQDFFRQFLVPFAAALGSVVVCSLAAFIAAPEYGIFAGCCGFATIMAIQLPRQLGLDWRAAIAMACVAIIGAVVIAWSKANPAMTDISTRYAARASAELISITDRMIGEVGIGGSGGGTFQAIYRLYAPQQIATEQAFAPTSAAQIAFEMGRPALWISVILMAALIVLCAHGSFNRGRDLFYSAAGAGIGVTTLVVAFCDIGLNSVAISILLAAALGLALAQSASRTI